MWDAEVAALAGRQFNRISRAQLLGLGLSPDAIAYRVDSGRMVSVGEGVFAIAPVLHHDDWGIWMGATLTAPDSCLSLGWAGFAWGFWYRPSGLITVTRLGSGGPRRLSGVIAYRSVTVADESTELEGIPITTVSRTLFDLARSASRPAIARGVRNAIRDDLTSLAALSTDLFERPRRRGCRRMADVLASYSGLPLDRARSGAEVRALLLLRHAERPMPQLNVKLAGEEADLSWPDLRLIVEIDGGPFHRDVGEDARKEAKWRGAGWAVRRIPSDDVYDRPARLLAICPTSVPRGGS